MIHIIGLGGIGFWLTVGLSKLIQPDQITCWDDDTLAGGTGATRLPWGPEASKKTELLCGFLRMVFAANVVPIVLNRKFSGIIGINEGDTIVDCTDMPLIPRRRMWSIVKNKKARLLRVSYDGLGSVVLVSTGLPIAAPAEGGYATIPSLALSLMAGGLGAEVVKRYIDNPIEHFDIVLSIQEALTPP